MAETEIKTLGEIKKSLQEANEKAKQTNDYLERADKKFTPAQIAAMSTGQQKALTEIKTDVRDELNKQTNAITKLNLEKQIQSGFYDALGKFLGVDFLKETFRKLDKIGEGFGQIKKGFKDLGKALGLDKVAKSVGGFWDFLKKLFVVGLATIGFIKFIEGWNKADEIFGKSAGFGERLSAGLATIIGSFMGLTDGEINTLAKDINDTVQDIMLFLKIEFNNLRNTLKATWPDVKTAFNGFVKILEGDLIGGLTDIGTGITGVTKELVLGESLIGNVAGIVIMYKVFKAIVAAAIAVKTIGSGILTALAAVGGLKAFLAVGGALATATLIVSAIVGIFGGIAAHDAAIKRATEEFEKSDKSFGAKLLSFGHYLDEIIKGTANAIVGIFGITPEDMDKYNKDLASLLEPIFNDIAGLFKSIWNWVKNSWDDVTFNIKDALGMELTQAERLRKADKDIAEAQANVAEQQAKVDANPEYGAYKGYLNTAKAKLEKAQKAKFDLANQNVIDNKILQSGVSTYDDYMKSLNSNKQLTDEQRAKELEEASMARIQGQSFQNFQTSQITQNNAIIQKIRPQIPVGAN